MESKIINNKRTTKVNYIDVSFIRLAIIFQEDKKMISKEFFKALELIAIERGLEKEKILQFESI